MDSPDAIRVKTQGDERFRESWDSSHEEATAWLSLFFHSTMSRGRIKCVVLCMLLCNSGLCNGRITKRCLKNTTIVSYNNLVSQLLYDKR
jgi:hypothetical protein